MRHICLALLLFLSPTGARAEDAIFSGSWKTTNRKLDGPMNGVVQEIAANQWQGRFYGVWQRVPFDYTVTFSGPLSALQGTATIDGASYTWTGFIAPGTADAPARVFKGTFGGSRYVGSFELQEAPQRVATANSVDTPRR